MFDNMDQIVAYINAHSAQLNASIRYGTLDQYLDIVHGSEHGTGGAASNEPSALTFPVVEGSVHPPVLFH